jgi:hypothetical protein
MSATGQRRHFSGPILSEANRKRLMEALPGAVGNGKFKIQNPKFRLPDLDRKHGMICGK